VTRSVARQLLDERFGRPAYAERPWRGPGREPALREWTEAEQARHRHELAEAVAVVGPESGEAA
jgi:hypothetical protein